MSVRSIEIQRWLVLLCMPLLTAVPAVCILMATPGRAVTPLVWTQPSNQVHRFNSSVDTLHLASLHTSSSNVASAAW